LHPALEKRKSALRRTRYGGGTREAASPKRVKRLKKTLSIIRIDFRIVELYCTCPPYRKASQAVFCFVGWYVQYTCITRDSLTNGGEVMAILGWPSW
jgi:hypothetical protein